MGIDTSKTRQEVLKIFREIEGLKAGLISRKPMVRGTVYELKRKCGNPNCRCARKGQLHKQVCIAITQGRKKRLLSIPVDKQFQMEKMNESHREFRRCRVRFIGLCRQVVKLCNQIEAEQLKIGDRIIEKERDKRRKKG